MPQFSQEHAQVMTATAQQRIEGIDIRALEPIAPLPAIGSGMIIKTSLIHLRTKVIR